MMTIGADGHGEIAFGAMQASLDLAYGHSDVAFTWAGFDEMDEVSGSGSAALLEDGTLEIELDYHHGDEPFCAPNAPLLQQPARNIAFSAQRDPPVGLVFLRLQYFGYSRQG
jgi:hypothetical protein